jgi:hypothetical protein
MTSSAAASSARPDSPAGSSIDWRNLYWVAAALGGMVAAILYGSDWLLNYVHVMAGVLWTGIDLFMGFVVGPVLRRVEFPVRRAIVGQLMPRMLFIMPTVSIITGTAGWFLAERRGYLDLGYPEFWWVAAALAITTALTIQGIGILLPTNLSVFLEMRKPEPDGAQIGSLMRRYVRNVALQGALQIAIIIVMARFVTGL